MKPQHPHSIDEELVAAYVDGDVTVEERQRVENAMAADEQVAWEVNTLRQTVELLQDLPSVPLPRSFTLTEDQVEDVLIERRRRANLAAPPPHEIHTPAESAWRKFLNFLNGGDLALRNAAALAAVLLLVVTAVEFQWQQSQPGVPSAADGELSSGGAAPQAQVTAVGGAISEQTAASDGESSAQTSREGAPQEDEEPVFGVMSVSEDDQEAAAPAPEQAAPVAIQPETNAAGGEQLIPESAGPDSADQPLLTVFRYARVLLVVAVIALWLLSRTRSRSRRA